MGKKLGPMMLQVDQEVMNAQRGKQVTTHTFNFDSVFMPGTQEEVFADCRELVQSAVDGYNVALFAYGQAGSGKTFTLRGVPGNNGIAQRTITEIFDVVDKNEQQFEYFVTGSILELYCNEIVDLLVKKGQKTP